MFDSQAPDIQVVADGDNDINLVETLATCREKSHLDPEAKTYHKAAVNSNCYAQHTEQVCNLVHIVA